MPNQNGAQLYKLYFSWFAAMILHVAEKIPQMNEMKCGPSHDPMIEICESQIFGGGFDLTIRIRSLMSGTSITDGSF